MPPRNTGPGHCELCGQALDKSRLITHFDKCLTQQRPEDIQPARAFLLEIKAMPYWLAVMARADAELADLDDFLRGIWLECCGHLSAFTIDGDQYGSAGFEEDEDDDDAEGDDAEGDDAEGDDAEGDDAEGGEDGMAVRLDAVLKPRLSFGYDYDFSTATSLELKVLAEREVRQSAPVKLLARNDAPEIVCEECDRPAAFLCSECIWSGEGALCVAHAPAHPCEQDLLLPVVNSPRCGICGYTGEAA